MRKNIKILFVFQILIFHLFICLSLFYVIFQRHHHSLNNITIDHRHFYLHNYVKYHKYNHYYNNLWKSSSLSLLISTQQSSVLSSFSNLHHDLFTIHLRLIRLNNYNQSLINNCLHYFRGRLLKRYIHHNLYHLLHHHFFKNLVSKLIQNSEARQMMKNK